MEIMRAFASKLKGAARGGGGGGGGGADDVPKNIIIGGLKGIDREDVQPVRAFFLVAAMAHGETPTSGTKMRHTQDDVGYELRVEWRLEHITRAIFDVINALNNCWPHRPFCEPAFQYMKTTGQLTLVCTVLRWRRCAARGASTAFDPATEPDALDAAVQTIQTVHNTPRLADASPHRALWGLYTADATNIAAPTLDAPAADVPAAAAAAAAAAPPHRGREQRQHASRHRHRRGRRGRRSESPRGARRRSRSRSRARDRRMFNLPDHDASGSTSNTGGDMRNAHSDDGPRSRGGRAAKRSKWSQWT